MIVAIVLFVIGMAFSAFFSGSETGFYRMTRLKLVMDSAAGDRVSRIMLWMANHPTLFVATALIGNNVANFLTSTAVVLGTHALFVNAHAIADLAAPIVVAPLVFIGGELLPKNLFFAAPNRLMRRCGPALVACSVLFAPITIVLWLVSQGLRLIARQTPQQLSSSLARREIGELMAQGHEAGILNPVQRKLAQNMLAIAALPIESLATPASRVSRATTTMARSDILRLAQRQKRTLLPVEDSHNKRKLVGYVRTIDLVVGDQQSPPAPLPMVELRSGETFISAISKFSVSRDALGHVVGQKGETVGFVTGRELRMVLLRTAL